MSYLWGYVILKRVCHTYEGMERVSHACEVFNKNLIFGQKLQFCLGVLYEQFALSPNEDVRERNSLHHHLSLYIPWLYQQKTDSERRADWKLLQSGSRILMIKNAFLTNVVQVVVQAWKFAREVIHMRICTSARASENLFCCSSSSLSLILNFILLSNFVSFFVNYVIFREWVRYFNLVSFPTPSWSTEQPGVLVLQPWASS